MQLIRFLKEYCYSIAIVGTLLFLYELATAQGLLKKTLYPRIPEIVTALVSSLPDLMDGLVSSLGLLLPSYLLALVVGIVGGLVVGWYGPVRRNLLPIFRGISPVPPTLYIPYAIAIFPTFWLSSAFVIFIGSLWPVLMGTVHGVVLLEEKYLDNARTLGLSGFKLLRKVVFPAALPMIFNGAGVALVFAFVLLTVAEMFGVKSGMGFFIQHHADFFEYSKVIAGMIFMSTAIILIMVFFDRIQNRMLYWTTKR